MRDVEMSAGMKRVGIPSAYRADQGAVEVTRHAHTLGERLTIGRKGDTQVDVKTADVIRALKEVGLTAEDFREPTFQEQFAELPVDTVFVVTNSPVVQNPEPRFIKVTQDKFYKTGDEQGYHPDPVMSYYGVKVISKPVEN